MNVPYALGSLPHEEAASLARRAVEALEGPPRYDGVEIHCWDKADADAVISHVPEELRGKIQLLLMEFK